MNPEQIDFEELLRRTLAAAANEAGAIPVPPLRRRLHRELAAAAAHGSRVLSGTWTDSTGAVTTEVTETDDGRLRVLISSSDPTILFVRLQWSLVAATGVFRSDILVTPLSSGPIRRAAYDLGDVEAADAVDVVPAEPASPSEIRPDDVTGAFRRVEQLGSAQRAWTEVADDPRCPPDVAGRVRDLL